jgi:hypothetical protein
MARVNHGAIVTVTRTIRNSPAFYLAAEHFEVGAREPASGDWALLRTGSVRRFSKMRAEQPTGVVK